MMSTKESGAMYAIRKPIEGSGTVGRGMRISDHGKGRYCQGNTSASVLRSEKIWERTKRGEIEVEEVQLPARWNTYFWLRTMLCRKRALQFVLLSVAVSDL